MLFTNVLLSLRTQSSIYILVYKYNSVFPIKSMYNYYTCVQLSFKNVPYKDKYVCKLLLQFATTLEFITIRQI